MLLEEGVCYDQCVLLAKLFLAFALFHSVLQSQILIPKKGNAKECSNYHTIALISHASKVILKIL